MLIHLPYLIISHQINYPRQKQQKNPSMARKSRKAKRFNGPKNQRNLLCICEKTAEPQKKEVETQFVVLSPRSI